MYIYIKILLWLWLVTPHHRFDYIFDLLFLIFIYKSMDVIHNCKQFHPLSSFWTVLLCCTLYVNSQVCSKSEMFHSSLHSSERLSDLLTDQATDRLSINNQNSPLNILKFGIWKGLSKSPEEKSYEQRSNTLLIIVKW